jgi:hypothetical protein
VPGDRDPVDVDDVAEHVAGDATLLGGVDQRPHVTWALRRDDLGGRRGVPEQVGEGVADVVGRDHHEAVAGERLGQEVGLEPDPAVAVAEDDEGVALTGGHRRLVERERRGDDQRQRHHPARGRRPAGVLGRVAAGGAVRVGRVPHVDRERLLTVRDVHHDGGEPDVVGPDHVVHERDAGAVLRRGGHRDGEAARRPRTSASASTRGRDLTVPVTSARRIC